MPNCSERTQVLQIKELSPAGASQLAVDLEYLRKAGMVGNSPNMGGEIWIGESSPKCRKIQVWGNLVVLGSIGDEKLPSYVGIVTNHDKDPY